MLGVLFLQLKQLVKEAKTRPKQTIAIANAFDPEVLQAVVAASEMELAYFLLFGDETKIRPLLKELDVHQVTEPFVTYFHYENTDEAMQQAILACKNNQSSILMKGKVPTSTLIKEVLKETYELKTNRIFSQVAIFELPNYPKAVLLTDGGINIAPSLEKKVQIIYNAVKVAHALGNHQPKVALLAAIEHVNPAMPATTDAALLTMMNKRQQITDCIIDGPLAFDVAISKEAKRLKNVESTVAGDADILVAPYIEVANVLYKSFTYIAKAPMASILVGAKIPIVLTSRADTADSRLHSIALAIVTANKI